MTHAQYLLTARKLILGQATNIDIRRSVSTTYYAIFHHISGALFEPFRALPDGRNPRGPWGRLYRAAEHKSLKERCSEAAKSDWGFSTPFVTYAQTFGRAYASRIEADYDLATSWRSEDALNLINVVETAIADFDAADALERRAFLQFIVLRPRSQ